MQLDNKKIMDLAKRYGFDPAGDEAEATEQAAERYIGKSDEELLKEMMKLKQSIKKDPVQFRKQLTAIRAMRGMLTGEQREKLDRIIKLLEEE